MGDDRDVDVVRAFAAVPRRVFLDSCTLQWMLKFGGFIWENEPLSPTNVGDEQVEDLEALQAIFQVNERAMFEFALSEGSLQEVVDAGDTRYTRWALDVLDNWNAVAETYAGQVGAGRGRRLAERLDEPRFGYLSIKDKRLLRDAVALECDAFLTMEMKLPKNARHIGQVLGLRILRPREYWDLLRPWAALYR